MDNFISLQQAIDMTTLFRDEKDNLINPNLAGQNILPNSETFDRAALDAILSQTDCVGIRIYAGLTKEPMRKSIVVGVNSKNEDMLPSASAAKSMDGDGDNSIAEEGQPCPPFCPPPSALNP